jgi:rhodanese-related sulfurtransferase
MINLFDLFKSVPSISPDEVREYMKGKRPDEYILLDVRQPMEYEQGHLPGSRLLPISELSGRLGELDSAKTIIVYCRSGGRSRSATSLLMGANFKKVLNMEGGITRYHGSISSGPPDAGMFCFPASLAPGQLAAVAWFIEDGTIKFLESIPDIVGAVEIPVIFREIIDARHAHKNTLQKLYTDLTGRAPSVDFPRDVLDIPAQGVMAGCINISSALEWAQGKTLAEIVELMISLGANAYDLYLKLGRMVKSDEAREVFTVLSKEEERNIDRIASAYEKIISHSK